MTIEVRHLLITSHVEEGPARSQSHPLPPEQLARLRADLLRECRALVSDLLDRQKER